MIIANSFATDINRNINGIIKVEQTDEDFLVQELDEYVLTKEIKQNLLKFLQHYNGSDSEISDNIGVWISGFFGCGKSHFLKILACLLENRSVKGQRAVERFRQKLLSSNELSQALQQAAMHPTQTILFNIDTKAPQLKSPTVILQIFAKVFFEHLGFYGESLKLAMLEHFIDNQGKTAAFRQAYLKQTGCDWQQDRRYYALKISQLESVLREVLGLSAQDIQHWSESQPEKDFSIEKLADLVNEYVQKQPDSFRLLFMADEVGQYVGQNTDLLLNLQSLVESLGSVCLGKVWVICTGQEAIGRTAEKNSQQFSRIKARFKTHLAMTSSSVQEVIQKRLLTKTVPVQARLQASYSQYRQIFSNIFAFVESVTAVRGYKSANEFAETFPFVPYQFVLMREVFSTVSQQSASGQAVSRGERSLLLCFQEVLQSVQKHDENYLVPLALFFETLGPILPPSVSRVFAQCQQAVNEGHLLKTNDLTTLKLLYLLRYLGQMLPANLDNLVILMADNCQFDKASARAELCLSLQRLQEAHLVNRCGSLYAFLSEEEQDIQCAIARTEVEARAVTAKIGELIYAHIFDGKRKIRLASNSFSLERSLDGLVLGGRRGYLKIAIYTARQPGESIPLETTEYAFGRAIVFLGEAPVSYSRLIEESLKIEQYSRQVNFKALPAALQSIHQNYRDKAQAYLSEAEHALQTALVNAEIYVSGHRMPCKGHNASEILRAAVQSLGNEIFAKNALITKHAKNENELRQVCQATNSQAIPNAADNLAAEKDLDNYLTKKAHLNEDVALSEIMKRYAAPPYGWKELDTQLIIVRLYAKRQIRVAWLSQLLPLPEVDLVSLMRDPAKLTELTLVKWQNAPLYAVHQAVMIMRDYFNSPAIPQNEAGLVASIAKLGEEEKWQLAEYARQSSEHAYPCQDVLQKLRHFNAALLEKQAQPLALILFIVNNQELIAQCCTHREEVKEFFNYQAEFFDAAALLSKRLSCDSRFFSCIPQVQQAWLKLHELLNHSLTYSGYYNDLAQLHGLMQIITEAHGKLIKAKAEELAKETRQWQQQLEDLALNCQARHGQLLRHAQAILERSYSQTLRSATTLTEMDSCLWHMYKIVRHAENAEVLAEAIANIPYYE